MLTFEELSQVYRDGNYRRVITEIGERVFIPSLVSDGRILLLKAWSYHQLGEYKESLEIFEELLGLYRDNKHEVYISAARGMAHGLIQTNGDLTRAYLLMETLPFDANSRNFYLNAVISQARKGEKISPKIVISIITNTLSAVPYEIIHAHIINNGAFALYEAREQESVKPYLSVLPGLIFCAIKIYSETEAAENHLAGSTYRASLICEAFGWLKFAVIEAETSVRLWTKLVAAQGGERYAKNFEGAKAQLKKLVNN